VRRALHTRRSSTPGVPDAGEVFVDAGLDAGTDAGLTTR